MAKKKTEAPSREPIVTEWCGQSRYECPVCGRDSDSESTIRDCIAGHFPTWLGDTEAGNGAATVDENGEHGTVSNGGGNRDDDGGGHE